MGIKKHFVLVCQSVTLTGFPCQPSITFALSLIVMANNQTRMTTSISNEAQKKSWMDKRIKLVLEQMSRGNKE